jgi:F-type H+-transporting ATPase subunit gamma
VAFASNRGFAGAFNANVTRALEAVLRSDEGPTIRLVLVGKKLNDYFRRRDYPVLATFPDLGDQADGEVARQVTQKLIALFRSGEVDAVDLVYSQFVSAMTRRVVREPFLPIGLDAGGRGMGDVPMMRDYIFEPSAEALVARLLPRYATTRMLSAFAESFASEHSARMIAMGSARKNAGELIDALVLMRNRLRQAVITKEISEIVGGAEALK